VSRVTGVVVFKDDVLLVLGAVNDLGRASRQLVLDLRNHGEDKGTDDLEDKEGHLLLKLLDDLGEDGDLGDGLREVLEELIVEFDGRHDLPEDLANVFGKLLGLSRRHGHVLHLGSLGVALEVVQLGLLVLVTKQAVGDLVEQVAKKAEVVVLALLESSLQVLDLALDHLIGHCHLLDL
jgi:hypothetical protein